jgi:hypothetical protein
MGDFEGAPPFGGVPFEVVSVPQPKENRLPIINPASSFFTVWPSFLVLKGSVIESAGGEPAAKEKIHNAFIYSQKNLPPAHSQRMDTVLGWRADFGQASAGKKNRNRKVLFCDVRE